jgi:hypothetical protein
MYLVRRVHQRVQNSSAICSEVSLIESRKQPLFGVKNLPICFTTQKYFKKGIIPRFWTNIDHEGHGNWLSQHETHIGCKTCSWYKKSKKASA